MRLILASLSAVFLTGCACHSHALPKLETAACMNHRAMMAAPMPRDAIRRLQERCAASRQ